MTQALPRQMRPATRSVWWQTARTRGGAVGAHSHVTGADGNAPGVGAALESTLTNANRMTLLASQNTTAARRALHHGHPEIIEISDDDYRTVGIPCNPLEEPVPAPAGTGVKRVGNPRDRRKQA